jgi:hypothetical protein
MSISCSQASPTGSTSILKLEFSVEEGTFLLNAIHTAIKAEGLDCAIVLVPIAMKLKGSYKRMEAENADTAQGRVCAVRSGEGEGGLVA